MSINNTERPSRIIFFFPYRGIGGVPLLFLRMATAIRSSNPCAHVVIVDYPDGYMVQNLMDNSIEVISLQPTVPINLYDDDILILQSVPLWRLPEEVHLSKNTKIMMWHLHPLNILSPSRRPDIERGTCFGMLKAKIRDVAYLGQFWQCQRLLMSAHRHRGLIFMDQENYDVACQLNEVQLSDPIFVPIPTLDSQSRYVKGHFYENGMNVGWVGRLEDFKLPILFHTIDRLERVCKETGRKITFHIAGDGPGMAELRVRQNLLDKLNSGLNLRLYGIVAARNLDQWLIERVQVLFAMGTAALDGAKNSIPTVLLDFSYSPINGDYIYNFLQDTKGFTLGRLITPEQIKNGNLSLDHILQSVESSPQMVASNARKYFENNHSLDTVATKFMDSLQICDFRVNHASSARLLKPDLFLRLYLLLRRVFGLSSFKISSK